MMPKILIAGNYGAKNIGDEMILEGLIRILKEAFTNPEITALSANPEETQKKHEIDSALMFPAGIKSFLKAIRGANKETIKKIKECDYFILGGGGLFASLKWRANLIWGIQAAVAFYYKKPLLMLGQSIGPIKSKTLKTGLKKLFNESKLITVRDEESKKELERIGVEKEIKVIPDFAFKIPHEKEEKSNKKICVALRQMSKLPANFRKNISEFLDWLISEKGWRVQFIDFKISNDGDRKIHNEIKNLLKDKSKIEHLEKAVSSEKILKEIGESKLILAMRFHSIITAIKGDTPFIAINYAPKISSFLKSEDLEKYKLDLEETTFENLKKQFQLIQKTNQEIQKNLQEINNKSIQELSKLEGLLKRL